MSLAAPAPLDLTPLEQAAARVGLSGLKARVVPHDKRRGWWFRWGRGELLVSDRVLDRCAPADASALLVNEVLRQREARRRSWPFRWIACPLAVLVFLAFITEMVRTSFAFDEGHWPGGPDISGYLHWAIGVAGIAVVGSIWLGVSARVSECADDETVALLGDATPLVRGLNEMDFEEIHLGKKVLPARPDLHRRAERLVKLHRLCDAPAE